MTKKRRSSNVQIKVGGNVTDSIIHAGDLNIGLPKIKWPFSRKSTKPADEATLQLIDTLSKRFTLDELEGVCLELGIEWEDLPARSRSGKARQLVQRADQLERRDRLVNIVKRERPD